VPGKRAVAIALAVLALLLVALPASASPRGLAVLAVGDAREAAWPLAQAVYADDTLRPAGIDEPRARVLAGESPKDGAPTELRELAETRAAIRGDDAPSRQLLSNIASAYGLRGIVLVEMHEATVPSARVFVGEGGGFDAAQYRAEAADAGQPVRWAATVESLHRAFGTPLPASAPPQGARSSSSANPAATESSLPPNPRRDDKDKSRPFYTSPWFWGAVGAAAFGGFAVWLATRDSGPGTIHLQMQVPR
jgi:hypothetical protein